MKQIFIGVIVLLAVVVFVVTLRPTQVIPYETAVSRYSNEYSHFTEWKGAKLHYQDIGEGVPVMLLHGYAGSFDNWSFLVDEFPAGYRLIIPDLPGLGLSQFPDDLPEDTDLIELYADFSRHLIETLALDSVYLVGNSLGGFLAWETAVRQPDKVKKLVLLNAAGYSVEDVGGFFIKFSQTDMFRQIIKKGAPKFVVRTAARGCLGDKSRLDPNRVEAFHGMLNKEGTLEVISRLGHSDQFPDSTRIQQVQSPTLVVWGDKDGVIPVEHAYKFHRDIPHNELIVYHGSGHVPMLENSKELMGDMLRFFGDVRFVVSK